MKLYGNRLWGLIVLATSTVLLLSAMHLLSRHPVQAADPTTQLGFSPAIIDLTPGKTVTITVRVTDVQTLYGLELNVLYDPQRVTIKSIAPGDFLSDDFVVQRTVDSARGIARLAYTQLSPNQPVNGSGDVAVLVLEPTNCAFGTTLQLGDAVLADNNGTAIPHVKLDGVVQNANTGATGTLAGTIFHDSNQNGSQDGSDLPLESWPAFAQIQRSSDMPQEMILSGANGRFQFDNMACGTYALWSKNGLRTTPSQRIPLLAASDVLTVSVPITGTLEYPLSRLFLPGIARSSTP